MKINKTQYDTLLAKLDSLSHQLGARTDHISLHQVIDRIEHGLDKLLQSHAALDSKLNALIAERAKTIAEVASRVQQDREEGRRFAQHIHARFEDLSGQNANLLTQVMLLKVWMRGKKQPLKVKHGKNKKRAA